MKRSIIVLSLTLVYIWNQCCTNVPAQNRELFVESANCFAKIEQIDLWEIFKKTQIRNLILHHVLCCIAHNSRHWRPVKFDLGHVLFSTPIQPPPPLSGSGCSHQEESRLDDPSRRCRRRRCLVQVSYSFYYFPGLKFLLILVFGSC